MPRTPVVLLLCVCMCVYRCVCVCVCVCICVCVCVRVCVCVCVSQYIHVYIHICIWRFIWRFTYTHTHTHTHIESDKHQAEAPGASCSRSPRCETKKKNTRQKLLAHLVHVPHVLKDERGALEQSVAVKQTCLEICQCQKRPNQCQKRPNRCQTDLSRNLPVSKET
jgi:hypothetical protein